MHTHKRHQSKRIGWLEGFIVNESGVREAIVGDYDQNILVILKRSLNSADKI